jgi:hypothetical protein
MNSGPERSGTISIAGESVTVTQSGKRFSQTEVP